MSKPRNSDEAPDWDDNDSYIDLVSVLQRLDLVEESIFDSANNEPVEMDNHEATN